MSQPDQQRSPPRVANVSTNQAQNNVTVPPAPPPLPPAAPRKRSLADASDPNDLKRSKVSRSCDQCDGGDVTCQGGKPCRNCIRP